MWIRIPSLITSIFRLRPALSNPAPLPVTVSGSRPVSTEITALEVVVFPIPISPVPASSQPFSYKIPAASMPTSNAFTVSSLVMAGSFKKSLVPQAILRSKIPVSDILAAIPTSTGRTSAPAQAAIRQTQERLAAIFFATAAVTSCPVWVTPSSTIPLSAHMITMHFLSRENSSRCFTPATRQISSSSTPKLFSGFATRSQ